MAKTLALVGDVVTITETIAQKDHLGNDVTNAREWSMPVFEAQKQLAEFGLSAAARKPVSDRIAAIRAADEAAAQIAQPE